MAALDRGARFGAVSIFNHWVIAVAIIVMLAIGLTMDDDSSGPGGNFLLNLHKSIGVFVLIFGAWRVLWRLIWRFPQDVCSMPVWQKTAATAVHWLLLIAILVMPLSGYIGSSTSGHAVSFFGLFSLPNLGEAKWISRLCWEVHETTANILIALVVVHVLAALKHHVIDRDGTLRRMLGKEPI